jgi:hypothetical protein
MRMVISFWIAGLQNGTAVLAVSIRDIMILSIPVGGKKSLLSLSSRIPNRQSTDISCISLDILRHTVYQWNWQWAV